MQLPLEYYLRSDRRLQQIGRSSLGIWEQLSWFSVTRKDGEWWDCMPGEAECPEPVETDIRAKKARSVSHFRDALVCFIDVTPYERGLGARFAAFSLTRDLIDG